MGCGFPFGVDEREVIEVEGVFPVPILADRDVLTVLRVACAETLEGVADTVGDGDDPLSARDLDFPLTNGGNGE